MRARCGGVEDKDYVERMDCSTPTGSTQAAGERFRELSPAYRAANPKGSTAWAALERSAITGNRFGQKAANTIIWSRLATMKVAHTRHWRRCGFRGAAADFALVASHIPNADVMVVPEAGHSLYWERPDLFNGALLSFFAKHRG